MANSRLIGSPIERLFQNRVQGVIFVLVAIALSILMASVLVDSSSLAGIKFSLGIFFVGITLLWFLTTEKLSLALLILIFYMGLLEGYLKIMTNGTTSLMVYVIRNVLLAALILNIVFKSYHRKLEPIGYHFTWPPFTLLIGFYLVWCLINIFHPDGINLLNSIVGVRPHIEFVPLYFLGFMVCNKDPKWFVHLLITLVIIGVLNSVAAIHQYKLGPDALSQVWGSGYEKLVDNERLNANSKDRANEHTPLGRIYTDSNDNLQLRPPGLGSDAGFPAMTSEIGIFAILVLLIYYLRTKNYWVLGFLVASSFLLFTGIVVSATRSYLLLTIVGVTIGLLFYIREIFTGQKLKIVVLLIVGITILGGNYVIRSYISDTAYDRFQSVSTLDKLTERLEVEKSSNWSFTMRYLLESPLGRGLGRVGSGAAFFASADETNPEGNNGETEINFMLSELGVVGFCIFYIILFGTFLKSSVIMRNSHPESYQRLSSTIIFLYLLVFFINSPFGTGSPFPTKAMIWLLMGCFWALHNRSDKFFLPTKIRQW